VLCSSNVSSGVAGALPLLAQPNNPSALIRKTSQLVFAQCGGGRSGFLCIQEKSNLQLKDGVRTPASIPGIESSAALLAPATTVALNIPSEKVEQTACSSLLPCRMCLLQVSVLLWWIATKFSLSSQSQTEPPHVCRLAGLTVPTTVSLLSQIRKAVARCSFFWLFLLRKCGCLTLEMSRTCL